MTACPLCDAAIDERLHPADTATCPHCGETLAALNSDEHWVSIARVANLAEAGFISDELIGRGIDSRLHQRDEFDAVRDRWSADYLIRVPRTFAAEAANHIRQYLTEEAATQPTVMDAFRLSVKSCSSDSASWRPVIAVLLVAVASIAVGQRFFNPRLPHRATRTDLAVAIGSIGRSFSTAPAVNQPRYRLSFDPRQQRWTLESDRDNDGVFEQSQQFNNDAIVR